MWMAFEHKSHILIKKSLKYKISINCLLGDSANAVPHYQKLRTRVTHIWGDRKGQPDRCAMEGPRPGGTSKLIKVTPVPGKYELLWTLSQYQL